MPPPSWVAEAVVVLLPVPRAPVTGSRVTKLGALRSPLGLLGATVVAPARTIQLPADWAQTLPAASTAAATARNFSWFFIGVLLEVRRINKASQPWPDRATPAGSAACSRRAWGGRRRRTGNARYHPLSGSQRCKTA